MVEILIEDFLVLRDVFTANCTEGADQNSAVLGRFQRIHGI
jgi:hypothetical protein